MINLINSYNTYINDYRNKEKAFLDNFKPNIFQKKFALLKENKKLGILKRQSGKTEYILQNAVKRLLYNDETSLILCSNINMADIINTRLYKIFRDNNIKNITNCDIYIKSISESNILTFVNNIKIDNLFADNIDYYFERKNIYCTLAKIIDNVTFTCSDFNMMNDEDIRQIVKSNIYLQETIFNNYINDDFIHDIDNHHNFLLPHRGIRISFEDS